MSCKEAFGFVKKFYSVSCWHFSRMSFVENRISFRSMILTDGNKICCYHELEHILQNTIKGGFKEKGGTGLCPLVNEPCQKKTKLCKHEGVFSFLLATCPILCFFCPSLSPHLLFSYHQHLNGDDTALSGPPIGLSFKMS